MSKSLAERIGAETRKVMEEREKAKKEANMAFVLETLRIHFKNLGKSGQKLFKNPDTREISIAPSAFNKIGWEVAKEVLKEIGFKISNYTIREYLYIPKENVSIEIQKLLNIYYETYESFVKSQIEQAEADCKKILEKLQENEYEVEGIDEVSVPFVSETSGSDYETRVAIIMKEHCFAVTIDENKWLLYILKKSD